LLTPKDNQGFTLIEVLLAIFIFAVVISLIFTAYTGSIRIMNDTDIQADITHRASIALERMTEDLESVVVSEWKKPGALEETALSGRFFGENDEIDGRSADRIRFLSKARVVFDDQQLGAGEAEISYYLKRDENEDKDNNLILYRSETPVLKYSPAEETEGLELCRGLKSVEIAYVKESGETVDEWDSALPETGNKLPRAITIVLNFDDPSGDEEAVYPFRTSVSLPLSRVQNGHGT
jgi:prepilin-type N-terminal cleavage/methylation domain-containing protein